MKNNSVDALREGIEALIREWIGVGALSLHDLGKISLASSRFLAEVETILGQRTMLASAYLSDAGAGERDSERSRRLSVGPSASALERRLVSVLKAIDAKDLRVQEIEAFAKRYAGDINWEQKNISLILRRAAKRPSPEVVAKRTGDRLLLYSVVHNIADPEDRTES